MFKPLLAARPKRAQPLALNPSDNPLLYAFIAKICDAVGAPTPQRIDMDCQLNASASFRRGFRSMKGSDLVLTIGLPLVANFSAREFAGVVAHEFGHFTQGAGMRLSYIIRRSISGSGASPISVTPGMRPWTNGPMKWKTGAWPSLCGRCTWPSGSPGFS